MPPSRCILLPPHTGVEACGLHPGSWTRGAFLWNYRAPSLSHLNHEHASLVAQLVKNPSAKRETWVRSLAWEDPLEEGKATHSNILTWRIACTIVHGVTKNQTRLSDFHQTSTPGGFRLINSRNPKIIFSFTSVFSICSCSTST